jgi:RNA polymerase sigma factor (sigma-70 family)
MGAASESREPTRPSGSAAFTTTHWSLVLQAADSQSPLLNEALERLCRAYWPPIHTYLRRNGHSPEDARDLTQSFFAYLLERRALRIADPERGRFRSFLLGSLRHFLAHERERAQALKRGGNVPLFSLEELGPEEATALDVADGLSPEAAFDRRWALEQIERALQHLREGYATEGRGPLFDLLKNYVWGEHNNLTLAQIAARLELTEEAVKKAVQRLRARLQSALRQEIGQTLSSPDQIDEELRHLRQALLGQPPVR